ncbi:MAG: alpha/beta hydrolase [Rikenellaceae bacterium]
MKRVIFLSWLLLPMLSFGQTMQSNLSFSQADSLAGEHYRRALHSYADKIEGDWKSFNLKSNGYQMPFECYINGEEPSAGYPLYISLHGGGGALAAENDQQWENQKRLYGIVDGVYFVPRSPTNTWDMWHQGYMDDFLLQVVTFAIARLHVDPLRIYILGYSAGGDGVYNLATRLSDRFTAAAMMAGHPGDAEIENLRNLPFAIYMGADDTAYNRSALAVEWLKAFQRLNGEDQGGFEYNINIYAGKGHWMDGLDGEAIGWLANYRRVSEPNRVIWIQDDVLHTRKYNLEVSNPKQGYRVEQRIDTNSNTVYIDSAHYSEVTVWLNDFILNLDNPVTVIFNGREAFKGKVTREERNIVKSIDGRYDPEHIFWSRVTVRK